MGHRPLGTSIHLPTNYFVSQTETHCCASQKAEKTAETHFEQCNKVHVG